MTFSTGVRPSYRHNSLEQGQYVVLRRVGREVASGEVENYNCSDSSLNILTPRKYFFDAITGWRREEWNEPHTMIVTGEIISPTTREQILADQYNSWVEAIGKPISIQGSRQPILEGILESVFSGRVVLGKSIIDNLGKLYEIKDGPFEIPLPRDCADPVVHLNSLTELLEHRKLQQTNYNKS